MNVIQKLKLASKLSKDADQFEEGMKMKNATKVIGAVVAAVTAIITASPEIQKSIGSVISTHPAISAAISGVIAILSLIHDPNKQE